MNILCSTEPEKKRKQKLIYLFSSFPAEPNDEQPFVAKKEKIETNLYLYSVSPFNYSVHIWIIYE